MEPEADEATISICVVIILSSAWPQTLSRQNGFGFSAFDPHSCSKLTFDPVRNGEKLTMSLERFCFSFKKNRLWLHFYNKKVINAESFEKVLSIYAKVKGQYFKPVSKLAPSFEQFCFPFNEKSNNFH